MGQEAYETPPEKEKEDEKVINGHEWNFLTHSYQALFLSLRKPLKPLLNISLCLCLLYVKLLIFLYLFS